MSDLCVCGHPADDHSYERNKEADAEHEPPDCMVDGCDCTGLDTAAERQARRVEAFAARGPRYRRWADAFIGDDDPIFAIACELVDHELRIDGLAKDVQTLLQRDRAKR